MSHPFGADLENVLNEDIEDQDEGCGEGCDCDSCTGVDQAQQEGLDPHK